MYKDALRPYGVDISIRNTYRVYDGRPKIRDGDKVQFLEDRTKVLLLGDSSYVIANRWVARQEREEEDV